MGMLGRLLSRPKPRQRASRIVVSGDVLRPELTSFRVSQHKNILWLYHLLRAPLQRATGLPVEVVTWGQNFATEEFYDAAGVSANIDGWAYLYDADSLSVDALAMVNEAFHSALVVAFELPPVLVRALTALAVPWVDLSIHPVRFLPDLLFAFSAAEPEVLEAAACEHHDFVAFEAWASVFAATAVRQPQFRLAAPATLAIGQVEGDRSLIKAGRFTDFASFPIEVLAARQHSRIVLKPHPYHRSDFGLLGTGLSYSDIVVTDEPIYKLLAHPDITGVLTISSSVGIEAGFFGKPVSWLGRSPFRLAPSRKDISMGSHLSIGHALLMPDFWRRALQPYVATTPTDGHRVTYPANTLRMSLRNFWGYNTMTTDSLIDAWRQSAGRPQP